MVRIKTAVSSRRRKKRVLKEAKGQFGQRSTRYQQAKRSLIKGKVYAYRDRRVKKREIRALWIARINAACRSEGMPYSRFCNGLLKAKVEVNRQMLAELAVNAPRAFKRLVKLAQETLGAKPKPVKSPAAPKKKS